MRIGKEKGCTAFQLGMACLYCIQKFIDWLLMRKFEAVLDLIENFDHEIPINTHSNCMHSGFEIKGWNYYCQFKRYYVKFITTNRH